VALAVVVGILILLVRFGLVTQENATLIGALIALTGVVITQAVNTRIAQYNQLQQQKLETDRTEAQQELETGRAQAARFQAYLEQMEKLLLDHQLRSTTKSDNLPRVAGGVDLSKLTEESDDARVVAHAQTLAVLEGETDPARKGILLLFLYDSALIHKDNSVISLLNAPLSGADLSRAVLIRANLSEANLSEANLMTARYLTQEQIDKANGDETTKLPPHLHRPAHWNKGDEQSEES